MSSVALDEWVNQIAASQCEEATKKQTPEYRQSEAFCKHDVSSTDARNDLFAYPDSPFLFRKWIMLQSEQAPADIRECKTARKTEIMSTYIGQRVIGLLGCGCGNNTHFDIHPDVEYTYSSIKSLKGPCSVWSGHIGYCWEGTMADNRTQAGTMPQGEFRFS